MLFQYRKIITMIFSFELFLSLLFVVSNVFGDENDDAMVCLDLFNTDYIGEHCCERIDPSDSFGVDVASCFGSEEITCDNVKCVLEKRGIMKGENIDEDAAKKTFEKMIQETPNDKDVAERVLRECLNGKFQDYPPEDACPAFKFFTCVYINVQLACPKWKSSDTCSKMADSAKKCRELVDN